MIAPSLDCSRATACSHGSVRASWSSVKPFSFNSSAATWTVSASANARLRHRPLQWPVRHGFVLDAAGGSGRGRRRSGQRSDVILKMLKPRRGRRRVLIRQASRRP